eukprot:TRINITY_DN43855_c0_g1_i1.p1 TRINITY_DN43855_c0_g1~~TRINITY_DN43855_c0_g1_i1.p1  ORF type:complete len:882 (-),score=207.18 TRINITY_DN43855_c0_g1_i1:132-2777(-)
MAAAKAAGRVLLPDVVLPTRYDVRFEPDLDRFIFDGCITITVDVCEATDEISLHAKELALHHDSIVFNSSAQDGQDLKPDVMLYKMKDDVVTLKFGVMLPTGEGKLTMKYVGCLNDQMHGFYRSNYKDINGTSKVMASTQFETIDARRAFPCWDEPARKAVFAVTLVVDSHLVALSNMPEAHVKVINGGKKRELLFMDSPTMSTYLLAFVVGELDFLQARSEHGVLVKVYTPPGRSVDGEFALSVAAKTLDGYDDYFGISYPLPKLDMVAIPEFAAGAMENWGLVTYREVDLLVGNGASCDQRQRVGSVVTHELAHQWFGNLVTMRWWDDLWLNEGFASWGADYMEDKLFPEWSIWEQFTTDTQAAALRLDALRSSHPIQVPIARAQEAEEVFDAISYCKGSCVILMAHAYLGADAFRKGLQAYLQKHKYGNTETLDLWDAWGAASGMPIGDLMKSWTEQMGFPLLTVVDFAASEKEATMTLEQSWFLGDGSEVKPEEQKLWKIPVFSSSSESTCEVTLMTEKTMKCTVPLKGAEDFVKINAGQYVPMRVLYTDKMLALLAKAVEDGRLGATDRAGLVLDAFALTKCGKLSPEALVKLVASYGNETHYVPWDAISQTITGLNRVMMSGCSDAVYDKFTAFVSKLVKRASGNIGWEKKASDGHLDGLLRETLMSLQAKYSKDTEVIAEARRRFDAFVGGDESLLPDDLKKPVYEMVVKHGGRQEVEALKKIWHDSEANVAKLQVYRTIGFTADVQCKAELLEWTISGDIKLQDYFYPVASISTSSRAAGRMTWEFFKTNFPRIQEMMKSAAASLMDPMIQLSARHFCTNEAADDVEAFLKSKDMPQNQRTITQVLEEIRTNAAFWDRIKQSPLNEETFWDSL